MVNISTLKNKVHDAVARFENALQDHIMNHEYTEKIQKKNIANDYTRIKDSTSKSPINRNIGEDISKKVSEDAIVLKKDVIEKLQNTMGSFKSNIMQNIANDNIAINEN